MRRTAQHDYGISWRMIDDRIFAYALASLLVACGGATPPPRPCPNVEAATPTTSRVAECPAVASSPEPDVSDADADADADATAPPASDGEEADAPPIGAAQGGPRGVRPCEFRESVDTYHRTCTVKQSADGSLTVTAPGTTLNPSNGLSFRMGGGPSEFTVSGELEAFGLCRGPFSGTMNTVIDRGKKIYEVRFREHCMIVLR